MSTQSIYAVDCLFLNFVISDTSDICVASSGGNNLTEEVAIHFSVRKSWVYHIKRLT